MGVVGYLILQQMAMLSQRQKNMHKENICSSTKQPEALKPTNMLYRAIEILKEEKSALETQHQNRERVLEEDKRKLRIEIQLLKKKINDLSEQNILSSLIKSPLTRVQNNSENLIKQRRFEMQIQHLRANLLQKDKIIQSYQAQAKKNEQRIHQLKEEKQKNMEISLMEKIQMQEQLELANQQVASKKNIIAGMTKQIERINQRDCDLRLKEKQMIKRGKDMQKYEKQYQSFYDRSEKKLKSQIENLEKQNEFLKDHVKKILKTVKSSCECEGEADHWKEKLFRMGRELAKAKVEICKISNENEEHRKTKNKPSKTGYLGADDISIESLSLSEDSDGQRDRRKTVQKK